MYLNKKTNINAGSSDSDCNNNQRYNLIILSFSFEINYATDT